MFLQITQVIIIWVSDLKINGLFRGTFRPNCVLVRYQMPEHVKYQYKSQSIQRVIYRSCTNHAYVVYVFTSILQ
jgi:hypothetical protein